MEVPFDPAIPLLGLYPKNPETIQKNLSTLIFIVALFTIAKIWKRPKCPLIDERIKKMWYIYIMNVTQPEKNEILSFATTWMDLEGIVLIEISQGKTNVI